ncbi:MAG TPA: NAD-dependent epimerase/dehydratase family protein [Solirubrobacteraceae bacterium]
MKALVTGGAGFIGSNLVDALIARGDAVAIVDNLTTGKRENVNPDATLHEVDIRDAGAVRAVFDSAQPDVVFHLAAQADVRKSIDDPAFDASVNVLGTINLLEAARHTGAKRFVNTSTGGGIYGEVDVYPTPETVPPQPIAAYGQSKACAEAYCGWAHRLYGMETVTLRYGNVYGPRQDPSGDAGVIAIFCGRALSGEPATIFGDGLQTRDYVYVADIVAANLLAAEHADAPGRTFNVGTEAESTLLDVVEALRAASGKRDFQPDHAPARLGELQRSALDVALARETLGYRAQVDLREGIARTWEWLRGEHAT